MNRDDRYPSREISQRGATASLIAYIIVFLIVFACLPGVRQSGPISGS